MENADLQELSTAVELLERPHWVAQVTNAIGVPLEWAVNKLSAKQRNLIERAVSKALHEVLVAAIKTTPKDKSITSSKWFNDMAVIVSGGVGGFFGDWALMVELPVTTGIILRSVAAIAKSHGEDLDDIRCQLACIEVFAFKGNNSITEEASKSFYWNERRQLDQAVDEVALFLIDRLNFDKVIAGKAGPILERFLATIAARYEVLVSEEAAAQIVPVLGAATGALINHLFIQLFQRFAEGHFVVRKLERKYGTEETRTKYLQYVGYTNQYHSGNSAWWRFDHRISTVPRNSILRIEVLAPAVVRWTKDNWKDVNETHVTDTEVGVFAADLDASGLNRGDKLAFTFFWKDSNKWEGKDFAVSIT